LPVSWPLVKVKAETARRSDIVNLVSVFRANIIDVNKQTMIIEILGDEKKINAFCAGTLKTTVL